MKYILGLIFLVAGNIILWQIDWRLTLGIYFILIWISAYLEGDREDINIIKDKLKLK